MWGFMKFKEPDTITEGGDAAAPAAAATTTRAGWSALPLPGPPPPPPPVGEAPARPPPAVRCADGWWHSPPIDLLADGGAGAHEAGAPGVVQLVAPPWEFSVRKTPAICYHPHSSVLLLCVFADS